MPPCAQGQPRQVRSCIGPGPTTHPPHTVPAVHVHERSFPIPDAHAPGALSMPQTRPGEGRQVPSAKLWPLQGSYVDVPILPPHYKSWADSTLTVAVSCISASPQPGYTPAGSQTQLHQVMHATGAKSRTQKAQHSKLSRSGLGSRGDRNKYEYDSGSTWCFPPFAQRAWRCGQGTSRWTHTSQEQEGKKARASRDQPSTPSSPTRKPTQEAKDWRTATRYGPKQRGPSSIVLPCDHPPVICKKGREPGESTRVMLNGGDRGPLMPVCQAHTLMQPSPAEHPCRH